MTRVDFKQGVLQGGSGKSEKWVPCCQRSSEAGYIVLKRACSVFKRPHKTLTELPLFTLTPQSTQKYEIPGRRKPQPSFCPVLTLLSLPCHITSFSHMPHHIFLWLLNSSIHYLFQIFSFPSVISSRASSHPLAFTSSEFFYFPSTHIKNLDRDHWNIPV